MLYATVLAVALSSAHRQAHECPDGMPAFDRVIRQARQTPRRIVLPESSDERILRAAAIVQSEQIAIPVLLGNTAELMQQAESMGVELAGIEIVDPLQSERREHYRERLIELRKPRQISARKSLEALHDPLTFACLMVSERDVDGCVAGANHTTAAVIGAALRYVRKHPAAVNVSSFFIMLSQAHHPVQDALLVADCALIVEPDSQQLAQIGAATGDNAQRLLGIEPLVAMLSFSTYGSARHAQVNKVASATSQLMALRPGWTVLGEIQLDAAVMPAVRASKAPMVDEDRACNVLIFPSLEAGNIGYKLMQRFGGLTAVGPILQGLERPVNDLSRGCTVEDVINMVTVTAAQCD